ncbi:MAG: MFS transporter, partial [Methylococcales bacterium]|nr:MFS transporter [Methylococcales bacterium]
MRPNFMKRLAHIDKRLLTILLIVFIQMVGAAMILPILPLFAKSEFGLSPKVITPLLTAFFAAQFIAGPYLGRLSDRYGRLPVLIFSQIGTAISFLMLAFAPSAAVLFAARILDGITGGNIIVAQAYITDITPREKRTEALGMVMATFGFGFIVGPAVGGILAAAFGPRIPYMLAAIVAIVTVFITWKTLDETVTPEQQAQNNTPKAKLSLKSILSNPTLVLIFAIAFVAQFIMGLLQGSFSLYGEAVLFADYNEKIVTLGIGLLLASFGTTQVLTQIFLLRRLLARVPETWLVVAGTFLRGIALF